MLSSSVQNPPAWKNGYMEKAEEPVPQRSRRNSWIHHISDRFAPDSTTFPLRRTASLESQRSDRSECDKQEKDRVSTREVKKESKKHDEPEKGFFSSLRRLSASRSSGPSSECRRVVYNKNPDRHLCPVQELQALKMKQVAFKVDEIDDETITREPLYCQIRRALKYQEALLCQKRQAIAAAISSKTACLPPSLDDRESSAGLDGFRSKRYVAKPVINPAAEKAILLLDGLGPTAESQSNCPLKTISEGSNPPSRRASISTVSRSRSASISSSEQSDGPSDLSRVYVRCCKLRELKPVEYIYNQLKGQYDHLETLHVSRPGKDMPFFGQLQVISDFLACVPVATVSMDDIAMSDEVGKMLLTPLVMSKSLKVLSLQRARLSTVAWKAVCYVVAMNEALETINLSAIKRKNTEWALLTKAVEARSAHINLIVTDCDISPGERSALEVATTTSPISIEKTRADAGTPAGPTPS